MAYNQFSRAISPPDLYEPISDDLLLRGAMETYNRAGKLGQNLSAYKSKLFGTQTYGKDAEVLQDYEKQFNEQVAELTKQGISSPEAISRFNSLISQYTNNEDILNINKRASFYNNEVKKEQEAAEKGQTYRSPGRESIEKYYNSGVYLKNPENINYSSGWVSPDTTKAMQEAVKMSTREIRDPKTGIVTKQAKPEDVSKSFYEIMKNNPNYQRDLQYSFEKENEGVDWNTQGQEFIQNQSNKLQQQFQQAVSLGDIETAQIIKNEYSRLQNLSDPTLIGDNLKQQYFQNYIQNQLDKVGYANDVSDFVKIERDPIQLKLQDLANQKANKLYEMQLKTGILPKKGESQSAYIQRLSQEAQKKDLEIAQAKQNIKTDAAKIIDDYKTANKIEILNAKGEKIAIKDDGAKQFNLNGEAVDKKMLIENIARGDKKIIEQIINSNPEQFGNSSGVDPEGFFGIEGGVWITEDNGVKYANYEADALVGGTKYRIPLTDIQKYIANPNHIVTVFSEDDDYKAPLKGSSLDNIDKSNVSEEIYVDADGNIVKGFTELSPEDQQLLLNNGVKKQ